MFSRTSLQAKRINQANPRALFFNDRVALGWVRDGEVIEVAVHDAREGIVFYELDQKPAEPGHRRRSSAATSSVSAATWRATRWACRGC